MAFRFDLVVTDEDLWREDICLFAQQHGFDTPKWRKIILYLIPEPLIDCTIVSCSVSVPGRETMWRMATSTLAILGCALIEGVGFML
jgi:hypothetical protein